MGQHFLDNDLKIFFNEHGYVVLKDLFSFEEVAEVRKQVVQVFETVFSDDDRQGSELIAATYTTRRDEWRACAKQMANSLALIHLSSSPRIAELLHRLGLKQPAFCLQPEVRVDMPLDDQYMQPWHQDWRSGQGSLNSVTIWLPLHDVCAVDGAIEILDGTHLWGLLETIEKHDPRRFEINDSRIMGASGDTFELCQGECLLFSQFLVHRSGRNINANPRLTCQLRFTDLKEARFIDNLYRAPVGSELVWRNPPQTHDMKKLHEISE